jgi:hypothetical protein
MLAYSKSLEVNPKMLEPIMFQNLNPVSEPSSVELTQSGFNVRLVYFNEKVTFELMYNFGASGLVIIPVQNVDFVQYVNKELPLIISLVDIPLTMLKPAVIGILKESKDNNCYNFNDPGEVLETLVTDMSTEEADQFYQFIAEKTASTDFYPMRVKKNTRASLKTLYTGLKSELMVLDPTVGHIGLVLELTDIPGTSSFGVENISSGDQLPMFHMTTKTNFNETDFTEYLEKYPLQVLKSELASFIMLASLDGKVENLKGTLQHMEDRVSAQYSKWKQSVGKLFTSQSKVDGKLFPENLKIHLKKRINAGVAFETYKTTKHSIASMVKDKISFPFLLFSYVTDVMDYVPTTFPASNYQYADYLFGNIKLMDGQPIDIKVFYILFLDLFHKLLTLAFSESNNLYNNDPNLKFLKSGMYSEFNELLDAVASDLKSNRFFSKFPGEISSVVKNLDLGLLVLNQNPRVSSFINRVHFEMVIPLVHQMLQSWDFIENVSDEDKSDSDGRIFNFQKFLKFVFLLERKDAKEGERIRTQPIPGVAAFTVKDRRRVLLI